MASGYSQEWSERNSVWTATFRLYYSSSYDPATNTSTITVVPQFKCSANYGNDYRVFKSDVDSYGGVLGNGYYLYQLGGDPGYGNYLVCGSATNEFANLRPGTGSISTFNVSHNANGYATFDLGFFGSVRASIDSSFVYGIGGVQRSLSIFENAPYAISYSANGGSGEPASQSVYAGVSYTLSSVRPTRTGYTFLGWATSPSATTAAYQPGASVTPNGNLPLYAVWRINSYTVTCEDRVGSASGALLGAPTAYLDYGSAVSGASFGSDATYDAYYVGYHYTGSSPTITVDGDETVYRYFALNTWTVSYDANGGSGAPSSQTKTYGVDLTISSTVPTRTGYDFLGWSTSSAATTAAYSPGGTYTANEGTVLYAVWQLKTYTVSYDANGGTGAPSSQTKTYGVDLTLSTAQPTHADVVEGQYTVWFDKKGGSGGPDAMTSRITAKYAFSFWQSNASGYTYSPGAAYQENVGCSMVAQWSTTSVVDTITLPTPTREGYTFRGWSEDPNASSGVTGNYTPSANVTLYAIWQLKTFTLTISQGAGSVIVVTRDGIPLSNGATISYFDLLVIVIHASTGYNLGVHTVNGQSWGAGQLSVSSPVYVVSTASKKTYVLSKNVSSSGVTVNVLRTSSPIGGAPNGLLSDGATLYHNDVLTASFAVNQGYTLETATVNGVDFSSAGTYTFTVTQDAVVTVEVDVGGVVYIGNGTTWEPYQVFIGNGSTWEQYEAFIGNGTTWEPY